LLTLYIDIIVKYKCQQNSREFNWENDEIINGVVVVLEDILSKE